MNSNRFSEDTLLKTLDSVRSRRRRLRNSRRGATTLVLAIGVASVSYWPIREQTPLDLNHSSEVAPQQPEGDSARPHPTIQVFATEDLKPEVILLDDDGLDRMLQGRSYGTYVAADGHRRLWVPDS